MENPIDITDDLTNNLTDTIENPTYTIENPTDIIENLTDNLDSPEKLNEYLDISIKNPTKMYILITPDITYRFQNGLIIMTGKRKKGKVEIFNDMLSEYSKREEDNLNNNMIELQNQQKEWIKNLKNLKKIKK